MSQIQQPPYSCVPWKGRNFLTKKDRKSRDLNGSLTVVVEAYSNVFNGCKQQMKTNRVANFRPVTLIFIRQVNEGRRGGKK